MLVDAIPPSMVEKYQSFVGSNVPDWLQKFFLFPETLSSAELMRVMEFASYHKSNFNYYLHLFEGEINDCSPFIEIDTGLNVTGCFSMTAPGFFSMTNDFVNFSIKNGGFTMPVGNGYSKMTITGTADNLTEVQNHVKLLVNDGDEDGSYIRLGLVNKDFVVRISRHRTALNFSMFNTLYHVGEWGKNLRETSDVAKTMDDKKLARFIRKEGVDGEDSRFLEMYRRMDQGLQLRYANFASTDSRKHESEKYFKTYEDYKETHRNFLVFEVLVLNREM